MSLKGNMASLAKFSAGLRAIPKVAAQKVTEIAAPAITAEAEQTFNAGEDPYGNTWAPGANGQAITLRKTGALAQYVTYVAVGTKLRVALGVAYAKYQIGKRPVFPRQGGALPTSYVRTLQQVANDVIRTMLRSS